MCLMATFLTLAHADLCTSELELPEPGREEDRILLYSMRRILCRNIVTTKKRSYFSDNRVIEYDSEDDNQPFDDTDNYSARWCRDICNTCSRVLNLRISVLCHFQCPKKGYAYDACLTIIGLLYKSKVTTSNLFSLQTK